MAAEPCPEPWRARTLVATSEREGSSLHRGEKAVTTSRDPAGRNSGAKRI